MSVVIDTYILDHLVVNDVIYSRYNIYYRLHTTHYKRVYLNGTVFAYIYYLYYNNMYFFLIAL